MAKAFVIDISKCSGCYNCQLACKDEHVGNDWRPYAAPQPRVGQFWLRVEERVEGTLPKVKLHYLPRLCNHCEKPACLEACPAGAVKKRPDGLVLIDPDACTGCGACKEACPYGAIFLNGELGIAQKCTGCAHLLDHGAKQPRCAEACPTDAMVFGEEEDLRDKLAGARPLVPGGKIWYKNIPGEFIGGTVYDPVEKEVVIGARCVLTGADGQVMETATDSYGDFWFRDLPAGGTYDLSIRAGGFAEKRFSAISTAKSVNLDDIPLERI